MNKLRMRLFYVVGYCVVSLVKDDIFHDGGIFFLFNANRLMKLDNDSPLLSRMRR